MKTYSCAPATEEHAEGDVVPVNPRTGQVEQAAKGVRIERWAHSDWGLEIAIQCACGWLSKSQNGSQDAQFYIDLAHDEWYGVHIPATLIEARKEAYLLLVENAGRLQLVPSRVDDIDAWVEQVEELAELGKSLATFNRRIAFVQEYGPQGRGDEQA